MPRLEWPIELPPPARRPRHPPSADRLSGKRLPRSRCGARCWRLARNREQTLSNRRMDARFDRSQPRNDEPIVEPYLSAAEGSPMHNAAGGEPRGDAKQVEVVKPLDLEAR